MKRRVHDWSVEKLHKERSRMSFPEYQREKSLWPVEKKILLIDSILQDIDIPKLYFNMLEDNAIEVVDGQQRLWSIWEFLDGLYEFRLNGKGQTFSQMPKASRDKIGAYEFQVTQFEGADDEYLRKLFVRLQLGLLLNTGEKLHAAKGKLKEFIFDKLAKHPFIKHLGIPERRFARQTLAAQICINSFTRQKLKSFARTRYDDLLHFLEEYENPQGKDLELYNFQTKRINRVMDELWAVFREGAQDLKNRSYILSLYLFAEKLIAERTQFSEKERKSFAEFAFRLWKRLRDEIRSGFERKNRELYSFETYLSSAPGEEYQIRRRHEKLSEYYSHFKATGKIKGDKG